MFTSRFQMKQFYNLPTLTECMSFERFSEQIAVISLRKTNRQTYTCIVEAQCLLWGSIWDLLRITEKHVSFNTITNKSDEWLLKIELLSENVLFIEELILFPTGTSNPASESFGR
jgi:hypothetical protein